MTEIRTKTVGLRTLPQRQINITMAGVLLAMFLSSLDQTIVGIAMPRIISDLGGFTHYTWVTTAYIITSAAVMPIVGKLTDMYGRKFFFIAGLVIFIGASLMCGLSNTMTQIIIWRGVQGIGAGAIMANTFTVVGDLFPPAERGKYQGLMSGVFGLSSVIGPTLGGFLTDALSWHWVFFVNIPLGAIIIFLFIVFFPNFRADNLKHQVDYPGVISLILTVVPMMLALSWGGVEYAWASMEIIGMFIFSAVMGVLFVFIESRSKEPIMPLSLFRNRIITVANVVIFFTAFGMFGGIIFVPLFFQGVLGVTATTSGSLLIPMQLGVVAGSFLSGQMLSRAGGHYRIQGAIGIGIQTLGIMLLSRMNAETSFVMATVNTVLTGFGLGVTFPVYIIAIQNAVPYKLLGVATSSSAFFRSIGGSVGLALFGSIMNNRFAADFISGLPAQVKAAIPSDQLTSLAHNPQALVSTGAQESLKSMVESFGTQGAALYEQVMEVLRQSLSNALSDVFLIAAIIGAIAIVLSFFIKEIPLRREHTAE